MDLGELREQLSDLPDDWLVNFTTQQSMKVADPSGPEYRYLFDDGRPPRHLKDRRRALALARQQERESAEE